MWNLWQFGTHRMSPLELQKLGGCGNSGPALVVCSMPQGGARIDDCRGDPLHVKFSPSPFSGNQKRSEKIAWNVFHRSELPENNCSTPWFTFTLKPHSQP